MNNNIIKKFIRSFLLISLITLTFTGCKPQDKEVVVTKDVSQQVKAEENEIKDKLEQGGQLLQSGKYDDAKKTFESAIAVDTGNKTTYLDIKDKYVEKNRIDDAFYFIKLAIGNNVDIDNMKLVLEDVKKKFEVPTIEASVYQKKSFSLPNEVSIRINNEDTKQVVKWNNPNIDTSKTGTFTFDGVVEQYERPVKLNLTVKPILKERKCGYVQSVYEENGKRYMQIDEIEFFMGDKAVEEAKKDKDSKLRFENGKYGVADGYYIRDKSRELKVYEISNKASFKAYDYANFTDINHYKQCNYNDFELLINTRDRNIFWINTENSVIISAEEQYTP